MDKKTGMYTKEEFFREAEALLEAHREKAFYMMAIDIEHFKLFNAWYGYEEGDRLLKRIGALLKAQQELYVCVSGYMGGDDFAIFSEYNDEQLKKIQKEITVYSQTRNGDSGFLPAFGIFTVEHVDSGISSMYDCALIALQSVKGNYARRTSWYNPKMRTDMEEEQRLLSEIGSALQKDELTFYLQPICNMNNGKIVSVETLLRWEHPRKGLIPPGTFLPILEQNGFITKVDLYIWEKLIASLSEWIRDGNRPIPASVNVSRVDFYALDLPKVFYELVQKYGVPPELLEIEITESAYMQNYELISQVIERLREYGFSVFMDDFGSGYSSLNMLRDVRVDAIKIDTKFLEMTPDSMEHGVRILEAIANIGNLMNMKLIAEGVETFEQVQFLKDMGYDYAQGYYFHRPMEKEKAEQLLKDESNLDFRGIEARKIKQLSVAELCNKNVISELMLNNMLGGVAFYEIREGGIVLARVNEQFFYEVEASSSCLDEYKNSILDCILEEDRESFKEAFAYARENSNKGKQLCVRWYKEDRSLLWLNVRIFFLREQDGCQLYYASVQNVTSQKRQEEELEESQKSLQAVLGLSGLNESFLNMAEGNRKTASGLFSQILPCGMVGGYCEDGFPIYFANDEMVRILGYDSYQDMLEGIDGKILNTILEEDRESVSRELEGKYRVGCEYSIKYRTVRKDGSCFWTMDKGKFVEAEDGRLAIVSACIDISDSVAIQEKLQDLNQKLLTQNLELNYLTNDQPGGYHRCADTAEFDFLYVSRRFLDMLGYTREQIKEQFDDKFSRMIHPDDIASVNEDVYDTKVGSVYNLEYRIRSAYGYIWVADQTKKVEINGVICYFGVLLDITPTVLMKERLEITSRQDRKIVENLLENTEYGFKANLTKDKMVMDKRSLEWFSVNDHEVNDNYSIVIEQAVTHSVLQEYREVLLEFLDKDKLIGLYNSGVRNRACDYRRLYKGNIRWMQAIYHLMCMDDSGDVYLYLYTVDVQEQKEKELELTKRAETDELTGLLNRKAAFSRMEQYLLEPEIKSSALIMLDLDRFKEINDNIGHVCGDQVLSELAGRLKKSFDRKDIVSRVGGDEFLVFYWDITEHEVKEKLKQIIQEVRCTYQENNILVSCSVSAGYVMIPDNGTVLQELYKKADHALLKAKRDGRNQYQAYMG